MTLMYSFPNFESVCCSMSSSNCCFLTCTQISQEAGKVVWCFHLFKKFPHFVVLHTVKILSILNEEEIDVFLKLPCFSMIQWMLAALIILLFLTPTCTSGMSLSSHAA